MTYSNANLCYFGFAGCNCLGERVDLPVELPTFSLADLGLTDSELAFLGLEDDTAGEDSELALVIAEVRAGNILLPDEGETLLNAFVEEEQAHANTLADLGDAEDRIAELEAELAAKDAALGLAIRTLELAARTMERQNEQARATILAGSFFAAVYI